jgi:hypothetical protein
VKTRASHPRLIGHGLWPPSPALLCRWQPSVLIQVKFEPIFSEMQTIRERALAQDSASLALGL